MSRSVHPRRLALLALSAAFASLVHYAYASNRGGYRYLRAQERRFVFGDSYNPSTRGDTTALPPGNVANPYDLGFPVWSRTEVTLERVPDPSSGRRASTVVMQVWSPGATFQPARDLAPATYADARAACPQGMEHVRGSYLASSTVEVLQRRHCLPGESTEVPGIGDIWCRRYNRPSYEAAIRRLRAAPSTRTVPMNFCMDRFQFPNREGAAPSVAVTFVEAEALCAAQQKRLCTDAEWTFACEGDDAWPTSSPHWENRHGPRSFDGSEERGCTVAGNVDGTNFLSSTRRIPQDYLDFGILWSRNSRGRRPSERTLLAAARSPLAYGFVLASLYGSETNGHAAGCTSPFGVRDLAGGVDEWTRRAGRVPAGGYESILKGGYGGSEPVRNRCRPATGAHGPTFRYYQIGFRCCADAR
ncbi:MAG: SUMF1/EgtB/PvdO family nonheme iron enzyme [Polyangiales bacterium]